MGVSDDDPTEIHFKLIASRQGSTTVSMFDPVNGSILAELRKREREPIETGPDLLAFVREANLFPLTPTLEWILGTPGFRLKVRGPVAGPKVSFDFVGRSDAEGDDK